MKLSSLTVLLGAIALSSLSYGATFSDQHSGTPLFTFTGSNSTPTNSNWMFDLTTDGFNPTDMIITGATATFWFADDNSSSNDRNDRYSSDKEYVKIKIGNDWITDPLPGDHYEYDGNHNSAPNNYDSESFVLDSYLSLIEDLQSDGKIDFKLTSHGGDGYLKIAKLTITTKDRPTTSVPDGGTTAALLGLGLIGLASVRNRIVSARR